MKIVNLFGGPCVGKSTTAASLFVGMKLLGLNVELVTEYAKDMVWEHRDNILDDQLYILAKQHRRLLRLKDKVDYIITDAPILQGLVYVKSSYFPSYKQLCVEVFESFDNINFLLLRSNDIKYQTEGRIQSKLEEAKYIDQDLSYLLASDLKIPFIPITLEYILDKILHELGVNNEA